MLLNGDAIDSGESLNSSVPYWNVHPKQLLEALAPIDAVPFQNAIERVEKRPVFHAGSSRHRLIAVEVEIGLVESGQSKLIDGRDGWREWHAQMRGLVDFECSRIRVVRGEKNAPAP